MCPNNLTASGIILQYWRPDINVSVWIVVFGVCIVAVNVRMYPVRFNFQNGQHCGYMHNRTMLFANQEV